MKKKKQLYLYERQYDTQNVREKVRITNKSQFWNSNLGKEFFEKLYQHIPEIKCYLADAEFDTASSDWWQNSQEKYKGKDLWEVRAFTDKQDQNSFTGFYYDFLVEAMFKVRSAVQDTSLCTRSVWEDYLSMVLVKLESVCIRTLISELHYYKDQELLDGKDEREEFQYFNEKYLNTEDGKKAILRKYPVLSRCIYEVIGYSAGLMEAVLTGLMKDKDEIEQQLCAGRRFTSIIRMEGNLSDTHRGGKSVVKLHLNNGCIIIYKPHSLYNDQVFYRFVDDIASGCGMEMKSPKILNRDDYGWSEYIVYSGCRSEEAIHRYFHRLGIYIFVTYLLGTHDLHCENIIAHGEYPVIIDLENLLGNIELDTQKSLDNLVYQRIRTSSLYSGILPYYQWQESGGVVLSAIGGGKSQKYSFKVPVVVGKGTSGIQIAYDYPQLMLFKNQAMLNQIFVDPGAYTNQMKEGFTAAYEWVLNHKGMVRQQLHPMEGATGRFLVADTQRYAMLLSSSYHPALLEDGADRQLFLFTMYYGRNMESRHDNWVVDSEISDMVHNDIPYFYMKGARSSLFNSADEELRAYFNSSPMSKVYQHLEDLSYIDMKRQLQLIQAAMELKDGDSKALINSYKKIDVKRKFHAKIKRESILYLAEEFADHMQEQAIYDKHGRMSWYTIQVRSAGAYGWDIHPVNMYLYDGIAGISLYFHLLYRCTGKDKYQEVGTALDSRLRDYTKQLYEQPGSGNSPNTGIYNGEASIVYYYLLLLELTGEKRYWEDAVRHSEVVWRLLADEKSTDLLDGMAGAVYMFCLLYEKHSDKQYLERALKAGEMLAGCGLETAHGICWKETASPQPLLGMSHGNAGVAMAFAKLYRITGQKGCYKLMMKAIEYEDYHYNDTIHNWLDFRTELEDSKLQEADAVAWCHGAGGILMARLNILEQIQMEPEDKEIVLADIVKAAQKLKEKCFRDGLCLCHGSSGNLLMLEEYLAHRKDSEAEEICMTGAEYMEYVLKRNKRADLPQENFNPGLMSGYLGIGFYFLKMHDENIPNILKLDVELKDKNIPLKDIE